jgi:opacity protein-like surface antigen
MQRNVRSLILTTPLLLPLVHGAAQERLFPSLRRSQSDRRRLFLNPKAAIRSHAQSVSFTDFFGYGGEVVYHIPGTTLSVGLSADYITSSDTRTITATAQRIVPVEDGYRVLPVEVTGYFRIPITEGRFGVFMGGGLGVYFGERDYSVAGVASATTATRAGFGIHVLGGVQYQFTDWFTLSAEMKFRDAQFEATNAFAVPTVRYGDILVTLPQKPFESSIHEA